MGSYWSLRLASYDRRVAAVVSAVACFNPNNTIFTQSSPRFKQMFMYMAGYDDEARFDKEVASPMTVRGHLGAITCPTLLITGEFDPLCPLEDAIEAYQELTTQKELWVIENQYHPLWSIGNLGGTRRARLRARLAAGAVLRTPDAEPGGPHCLRQGRRHGPVERLRVAAAGRAVAGLLLTPRHDRHLARS